MSTNNPLQALHSMVAYCGITRYELSILTREQLEAVIVGEADILAEVCAAHILVEHDKFDRKREARKAAAAAAAVDAATEVAAKAAIAAEIVTH